MLLWLFTAKNNLFKKIFFKKISLLQEEKSFFLLKQCHSNRSTIDDEWGVVHQTLK